MASDVLCLILGGGRGTRLYPLTMHRSKPAVPIGGKYRLIDIPISNCLNSGLNRIYVLTQFLSVSLHRHINNSYQFDVFSGGFVEILAAQQTMDSVNWYEGTADAVRRNLGTIRDQNPRDCLILSGDQLYRMDLEKFVATHRASSAEISIAVIPVSRAEAGSFGIMRLSADGRVIDFVEKPQTDADLDRVRTPAEWIDAHGIASKGRQYLASMGIYLFKHELLLHLLETTNHADFGRHIFPAAYGSRRVQAHLFDGYWEDVGTIASYYRASMELLADRPPFEFQAPEGPIYTRRRFLPAARVLGANVERAMISDGSFVDAGAQIVRSILGVRSQIGRNVAIRESVIIGADRFESKQERQRNRALNRPDLGVGEHSIIEKAILDKDCRIGKNVQIVNRRGLLEHDDALYCIRDGIVVIPKGVTVPDGMVI
jgi:glucose-1-phosphate adenylyltransferase